MQRAALASGVAIVVAMLVLDDARAEPVRGSGGGGATPTGIFGPQRLAIDTPVDAFAARPEAGISRVIYLERCRGTCQVFGGGFNDAENLVSTIPNDGEYRLNEFRNTAGETGAAADAEWAMFVQCMKEVYSPFDVEVTDVKPAAGPYHLALVAGSPAEVGLDSTVLGVAPLASNCAAFDNVISFSFANVHNQSDVKDRVFNVCWTAAQESAHAFGLDHEFEFVNGGRSACNDPMTYRFDCGGQKFYRNSPARCGEDKVRDCRCTTNQNSHKKLLSVFGPGTPITGVPTVVVTTPTAGTTTLPVNVVASASAVRGIAKLQLFLNGFPFVEVPGAPFGNNGQLEQGYGMLVPANVPDSIYDLFVRAQDDLGISTDTATMTVTKGTPCVTADTCLPEQRCEAGRCFWDPPVGELGDDCTYPAFCKSFLCRGTADQQICTITCEAEDPGACPSGMECNNGVCFFSGGCCSAGRDGWVHSGFLTLVVGFVLRRGRRRRNSQSICSLDIARKRGA